MIYTEVDQDKFCDYLSSTPEFAGWERHELEQLFQFIDDSGDDVELCAVTLHETYRRIDAREGFEIAKSLGLGEYDLDRMLGREEYDPFDDIESTLEHDGQLAFTFTNDEGTGYGFCLYF